MRAKRLTEPVLLHIVTTKGKGYAVAESNPSRAHGMPAFDPQDGSPRVRSVARSFGTAAGELLTRLAAEDPRIVAITAAMADSTGSPLSRTAFPTACLTWASPEHAVTLAAGWPPAAAPSGGDLRYLYAARLRSDDGGCLSAKAAGHLSNRPRGHRRRGRAHPPRRVGTAFCAYPELTLMNPARWMRWRTCCCGL